VPSSSCWRFRIQDAAARASAGGHVDWTSLDCDLGYSDQVHLTRDSTACVGISPARYQRICADAEPIKVPAR